MRRLVFGLLTAGQSILATTALILVSRFISACVAVEVIAKDGERLADSITAPIVEGHFSGVGKSILTLMQFVTMDGLAEIYYPLIMKKPWLCAYFLPILVA